jgi:hypothetical protein
MTEIAGSGSESGSISQRHGSADPDTNVMDPQQCSLPIAHNYTWSLYPLSMAVHIYLLHGTNCSKYGFISECGKSQQVHTTLSPSTESLFTVFVFSECFQ